MKILLRWNGNGIHVHVLVFVGTDRDHMALIGELTMRQAEAEAFHHTVRMGIQEPGFDGIFESGWPES